jgi:hypothetical protein
MKLTALCLTNNDCADVGYGSITEVEQLIRPAAALRSEPAIQFGIYEFPD